MNERQAGEVRREALRNIFRIILSWAVLLGLGGSLIAAGISYIPHREETEERIVTEGNACGATPVCGLARNDTAGTVENGRSVSAPTVSAPTGKTVTAEPEESGPMWASAPTDTEILSHDWSGEEEEMLLKMCMAEAESESTTAKALVILCILNRVWSEEFPDTIAEVLLQENQFTPILDERYYTAEPDADCRKAMEMVKSGWDQSQGCMWYESGSGSTWHSENLEHVYTLGALRFYRERGGA